MKNKLLPLTMLFCCLCACHKEEEKSLPGAVPAAESPLTLEEVKAWYAGQAAMPGNSGDADTGKTRGGGRALAARTAAPFSITGLHADLSRAEKIRQGARTGWIAALAGHPVVDGYAQGYRKLVFFRDSSGRVDARILEVLPDPYYLEARGQATSADFTGRTLLFDRDYRLLSGRVYLRGKVIGRIKPAKAGVVGTPLTTGTPNVPLHQGTGRSSGTGQPDGRHLLAAIVNNCAWYDNNYIDGDGTVVVFSQQVCSTEYIDDGGGPVGSGLVSGGDYLGSGGGGGGSASTASPMPSDLPGINGPKIDPKKYMGCFGTLPDIGSTCTVTVYVVEPAPGTSFNIGPNSVGHVAIGLTKKYGNTTITQTVGYYPDATGFSKFNAPSMVLDNGGDVEFDVSVSYQVIPQEFDRIVNYVSNPPTNYNLLSFNCTNFVYTACQQGGIILPDPYTSIGFDAVQVMTPGALGSTISNLTGESNVNTNGGTTPLSHGACD